MAKVLIFGVTGYGGGNIAQELLTRGHEVTGVARNAPAEADPRIHYLQGSFTDAAFVADAVRGVDVVVLAMTGDALTAAGANYAEQVQQLLDVLAGTATRVAVVGGAGTLRLPGTTTQLKDSPDFPKEFLGEVESMAQVLELLRGSDADWFFLSPAGTYGAWVPGEKTGQFRLGGDELLVDAEGKSFISGADYAIAFVNEIERPEHSRQRFTVAY